MGVYIKGMELPDLKENQKIKMELFNDNGVMRIGIMTGGYSCCEHWTHYTITEVPEPHGRLVEFIEVATQEEDDSGTETINFGDVFEAWFKMREAKPVIEAEGE